MKSECYFESEPWDQICTTIQKSEDFDSIIAISIHVICSKNDLGKKYNDYNDKISAVLKKPSSIDVIKNEYCISAIHKYENTIVRFFIDVTENQDWYDNFEIVTHNSLYIWKPVSRPQMHFDSHTHSNSACFQKFSCALGGDF